MASLASLPCAAGVDLANQQFACQPAIMGVEAAVLSPLSSSLSQSQSIAAVFSSLSSSLTRTRGGLAGRSLFLSPATLSRSRSLDFNRGGGGGGGQRSSAPLTRAISAGLERFYQEDDEDDDDEEEFLDRLDELTNSLHEQSRRRSYSNDSEIIPDSRNHDAAASPSPSFSDEPPWPAIRPGWPPDLVADGKANSIDLLMMMKKKKTKKKNKLGFCSSSSSSSSSVKTAFSSMVFIIRELQRYTMEMREFLFVENLQDVLARVHGDMHASFVWLFQQIFSCTPTLMLSLMLLLANFTVYSMAATAVAPPPTFNFNSAVTIAAEDNHNHNHNHHNHNHNHNHQQKTKRLDSSAIKMFSVNNSSCGGSGGGGSVIRPLAGATDDGRSDGIVTSYHNGGTVAPDGISTVPTATTAEDQEEARLWNRIVEEASRMQAAGRDVALMDSETLQRFVSPVRVEVEAEDQSAFSKTEDMYHQALSQDPNNTLLLCNFAQFLYLVLHDHDRAEYYFKRAVGAAEPADAESLSRYASFLWLARNDLGAAEETYLEAIAADPGNSMYAGNYAHFLWSTGGEDTCYPLD